jgi:hypothetical protein
VTELWEGGPVELPHTFHHAGVRLTLPYAENMWLLDLIAYNRWSHFYPGLLGENQGWELDVRLHDPTDTEFDIHQLFWVASTLLGRVSGLHLNRPGDEPDDDGYNAARVIAALMLTEWHAFAGWLVATGQGDPQRMPFWMLMVAAYRWQQELRANDPEQMMLLNTTLWPPPVPPDARGVLEQGAVVPPGYTVVDEHVVPEAFLAEEADTVQQQLREMGLL